ncbi:NAD(P)H-binding protein [uncultured Muriicola sp.]|uniref:NAD(P)H-binding protein n=1 Tax=uncultured Muriicola sp. TaxID=1583102 RepID=UPI00263A2BD2|nr:NAD(P)H-binding protein [uncultured Muriicola sp.]
MEGSKKSAIILGATGLTGGLLLNELLEDHRYDTIKIFSRSTSQVRHPKLKEFLGDLLSLSNFKSDFKADEVYCCIGTTKSKTPDKERYRSIDYGIPVAAAQLCKENDITIFLVISALGADAESGIFYNKIKGEMEKAVLKQGIAHTYILQPSIIGGQREERRLGEWIAKKLFIVFNILLQGPLKKYRSIQALSIAKAMIWLANNSYSKNRIISDEIENMAHYD